MADFYRTRAASLSLHRSRHVRSRPRRPHSKKIREDELEDKNGWRRKRALELRIKARTLHVRRTRGTAKAIFDFWVFWQEKKGEREYAATVPPLPPPAIPELDSIIKKQTRSDLEAQEQKIDFRSRNSGISSLPFRFPSDFGVIVVAGDELVDDYYRVYAWFDLVLVQNMLRWVIYKKVDIFLKTKRKRFESREESLGFSRVAIKCRGPWVRDTFPSIPLKKNVNFLSFFLFSLFGCVLIISSAWSMFVTFLASF